jgi:lipopolysaccharide biosynthesis glycosyltransferase
MVTYGIVAFKRARVVGQGAYSPGLEYDAQLYLRELLKYGNCIEISPLFIPKVIEKIMLCDVIIGFEEIGDNQLIKEMRKMNKRVVLVPNFEVMARDYKWKATLDNYDYIETIIKKTKGITIPRMFSKSNIITISHTALDICPPMTLKGERKALIHFAGSSKYKNTLNSIKAGIKAVEEGLYESFIIQITKWPKGYNLKNIEEIKNLCKHKNIKSYIGGYISDIKRRELYLASKVALCCSEAEGFGIYILDALRYGCQVVTTDGYPMRDTVRYTKSCLHATLAKVSKIKPLNLSYSYEVSSNDIYKALTSLPNCNPEECRRIYVNSQKNFSNDIKYFHDKMFKKKRAYVHLIMKGDKYIPGALVSAYTIKLTKTKYDCVCMVTHDVTIEGKEQLKKVFDKIIEIPYLKYETKPLRTKKQFEKYPWVNIGYTKWNALNLTDYDKVLLIDADKIVHSNLDHLFELQAPAGTFSSPWSLPHKKNGMFNPYKNVKHGGTITPFMIEMGLKNSFVAPGTMILLEPSYNDFNKYCNMMNIMSPFGFRTCNSMSDEQSLAYFYSNKNWTHIHQKYNAIPRHNKNWLYGERPCVTHYFGIEKPWYNKKNRYNYPDFDLWWDLAEHMDLHKNVVINQLLNKKGEWCYMCNSKNHSMFKDGKWCKR